MQRSLEQGAVLTHERVRRGWSELRGFFGLLAAGLIFAVANGAALSWDGSSRLFQLLDRQSFDVPNDRLINIPLQLPALLLSRVTDDLALLQFAFGLAYGLVPLLALLAAWQVVRDHEPSLFVWAALGIGLATLPGQLFFVAEAAMAVQLAWPLILAVLTRRIERYPLTLGLCALGLYFSHPFAIPLFALLAALAVAAGLRFRAERNRMLVWAASLLALSAVAALRFWLLRSAYESDQLAVDVVMNSFREGVAGLPLIALAAAWLAGLMLLLVAVAPGAQSAAGARLAALLERAALLVAGGALLIWAASSQRWGNAISYKTWVLFCALPFVGLAALDCLLQPLGPARARRLWPARKRTSDAVAAIFALTLVVQSTVWSNLQARLADSLARSPWTCNSMAAAGGLRDTPLNHWSVATRSLLLQGRSPERVALPEDGCGATSFAAAPLAALLPGRDASGWFDLSTLGRRLAEAETTAPGCSFTLTGGWHRSESDGPYWWRWSDGADAQLRIVAERALSASLNGQIEAAQTPATIVVLVNGVERQRLEVREPGLGPLGPLELELSSGANLVQLVSMQPAVSVGGRPLAFSLANLALVSGDPGLVCTFHP